MPITTTTTTNSYSTRKAYIDAWGEYVSDRLKEGWEGYLITFMFNHISGSERTRLRVMEREVERVYATLLTRLFRRPHARGNQGKLPVWVIAPDYPVAKHDKTILSEVRVNDGLHLHGAALFHPESRLETGVEEYVDDNLHIFVHGDMPLQRINMTPIVSEERSVVGYGFKTVQRRAEVGVDGFIVLSRVRSELKDVRKPRFSGGVRAIARRVLTLSRIYDHLLGHGLVKTIDFGVYLKSLCANLSDFQEEGRFEVKLICDVSFLLGVIFGSLCGHRAGRHRRAAMLALVAVLLAGAATLGQLEAVWSAAAVTAAAMGVENSVFERDDDIPFGVTYMTGALVKTGQRMAKSLRGGDPLAWTPYALLWLALTSGAAIGAVAYPHLGLNLLWFAATAFGVIAAATMLRRPTPAPPHVRRSSEAKEPTATT